MWLWEWIGSARAAISLRSGPVAIELAQLRVASAFPAGLEALRGRSVLLAADDQLSAAFALIELDGVARRLVLCPPDLQPAHLRAVIADAQADALVCNAEPASELGRAAQALLPPAGSVGARLQPVAVVRECSHETEWILLTSGTSGAPKAALHSLSSLTHAFAREGCAVEDCVWSTFYDIRRYGGLQILLRALRGSTLLLSAAGQAPAEYLAAAAAAGVTHISGTAAHWRSVLMSGQAACIDPRYVRLSGEIADQGILDTLRAVYPRARIAHAFASTEAGVAFEVEDGRAGFPAEWVDATARDRPARGRALGEGGGPLAELRVTSATLRVRSGGTAQRYLGTSSQSLRDAEGFVDTGDRLELRGGRYHFKGRTGGIINVGGFKVHPEEVEAVINAQPWVRMSLVHAHRSPITGALVSADVVLVEPDQGRQRPADEQIVAQIRAACGAALAAHKVPAIIHVVSGLPVSAAGKLVRPGA